ncbi:MAG: response regulator [Myxococcaceae bacterium]|nr:response regulator [Myxococcaceae bacterium]
MTIRPNAGVDLMIPAEHHTPAAAQRHILLLDDEPNVAKALGRSLRREGYQVEMANDAGTAFTMLKEREFDLVISDHLMPTMTGLEFLKLVRNRHPHCMRIMLTGYADMQTAIDAINHGEIYRFLTKPWDDLELKVILSIAFEQLDLERENRRLLALVRTQAQLMARLERENPGILSVRRDDQGAILLDT